MTCHFPFQIQTFLESHTHENMGGVSSTFRGMYNCTDKIAHITNLYIFNNYFQFSAIESSLDSKSAPYHWRNELNFTEVNVSSEFF